MSLVPSWSFSRLTEFEICPYSVKLKIIDRHPVPDSPAGAEGTRIHNEAEAFIFQKKKLPPELAGFQAEYKQLRSLAQDGLVQAEEEWAHTQSWDATSWKSSNAWLRLKVDYFVDLPTPLVIDLKTGKRMGNEIKHTEQTQLYAVCVFLRYPEAENVRTELWYPKSDQLVSLEYDKKMLSTLLFSFNRRALKLTEARTFPPRPSIFACRYCSFRHVDDGGTGACEFAVRNDASLNRRLFRKK